MISQDERERELYESRLKMRGDISYEIYEERTVGLEEGRKEGRAEGRPEGRAEGRAEGSAEGRAEGIEQGRAEGWRAHVRFLQKLLRREVVSPAELQNLTAPELEMLAARLQAEIDANSGNGS
jgi:flagellar biosynthesis/type III secretory pathway protein FliH